MDVKAQHRARPLPELVPEYNDHDAWEMEMDERLETEKTWEAAFEEGERLASETMFDDEEEDW